MDNETLALLDKMDEGHAKLMAFEGGDPRQFGYHADLARAYPTLATALRDALARADAAEAERDALLAERPRLVETGIKLTINRMSEAYNEPEPEDGHYEVKLPTLAEVEAEMAREAPQA